MTHPYVDNGTFKTEAFGRALAQALGHAVHVDMPGSLYPNVTIDCGDGLKLYLRSEYGAKLGRVEVFAAFDGPGHRLETHERPKLPSAGADSARSIEALAKDITRRVIEPARPAIAAYRDALAKRENVTAGLKGMAKAMEASFPGLQVTLRDDNATEAQIYFNRPEVGYLTGTMNADGKCSFQRVAIHTADGARRLFALLSSAA
jgi:hypothetical protein